MKGKRVYFEGRVQGVGFRYSTKRIAMGFDVAGWVMNLNDGRVQLEVVGEEDEVSEFLEEIVDGELAGFIKGVDTEIFDVTEAWTGFEIRR